ncbi:MAG: hypothetical protein RIE84_05020 [Parvibaculum sp.]|uniref:hypothetical protein n=1 Tax=Parvibaculum sp. TaxID=2024848 RepID=UPI0032EC5DBD
MSWYVVSYDLRREVSSEDYKLLYRVLMGAVDFCWPLESVWIIETPRKPSEVISILVDAGILDDDDGIIVLEISGVGNFRRVKDATTAQWLNEHITRV